MRHIKTYKIFEGHSNWSEIDDKLQKEFQFDDFTQALDFINRLAQICEKMNHHPHIDWVYNKVKLSLSTHDVGDIVTDKDKELASEIDILLTK
jgi:4a-hydroxytetrahydrobiopterin dehydratase